MPNEPESDDFKLPPELNALENRLRDLPSGQTSKIDRDDLMFRSGWAAAMAVKDSASDRLRISGRSRSLATRWGWPVLSGTFAAIAAALAIVLWVSPDRGDDSQMAVTPDTAEAQLVADSNHKEFPGVASAEQLTFSNPIQQAIRPYLENVIGSNLSPSSSLAMRSRLLRGIELDEMPRPRVDSVSTRPQRAPLKANSYRNQELWEQL